VKVEAVVGRADARRLRLRGTTVVARGSARVEAAATTYAFVRFDAKVRARIWRRSRTQLTLKLTVTDPAGNVRRTSEQLTLRR
jgi:hypothetical protein